jgi:hypothetical protein
MQETWNNLSEFGSEQLPGLIAPILILIVGWLLAFLVGWLVRAGLDRTHLDERLATRFLGEERAKEVNVSRMMGRGAYWLVLLLTVLAVLQSLQLTAATEPFQELLSSIFGYIPQLIGAALILLVAWIIALGVRKGTYVLLRKWDVDRRLASERREGTEAGTEARAEAGAEAGEPSPEERTTVARTIAETAYWLVFLLFVPAILGALQLEGLLEPVNEMFREILAFLPNLISAALVFAVGWFVAKIVMRLVTNVLAGLGLDRLSERVGLHKALGERPLSAFIGVVTQVLILIPVIIAALQALQLESVTAPASDMLETLFAALPRLFGAALVLGVAYVVGRLVRGLVRSLLSSVGFDRVLPRLGISSRAIGNRTPSDVVGILALVGIVYFAAMEAARMLEFDSLAVLMAEFAVLAGQILLGLVIFAVGLWLANLAATAVRRSDLRQADLLATVSRVSVLALAGAMALRQMGIANSIIELAFGLALGAIAVASAIAFGLGGREAAGRTIETWRGRIRERDTGVHRTGEGVAE